LTQQISEGARSAEFDFSPRAVYVYLPPKLFKTDKRDARTLAEALQTVPGVGVETATSFVSAPDEAV
jgi:hypothetical protein